MLALTVSGNKIREVFSYGNVIVDECILEISEDGLCFSGIDERQIGMFSVSVDEELFESYEAKKNVIGLPVGKFVSVLDLVRKDDVLRLYIDENGKKLNVSCRGLEYTLSLVNPDHVNSTSAVDELEHGTTIVMDGDKFSNVIDGIAGMYNFVEWSVDPEEGISVVAENEESMFDSSFNRSDLVRTEFTDCSGEYRVEYFVDINKSLPRNKHIAMQLDDDYPAKINFTSNNGNCSVEYVLAPRIKTSE